MKPFLAAHPETARAIQLINAKPFSPGFANATYNSPRRVPLRQRRRRLDAGSLVDGVEPEAPDQATAQDKNYLFDALIARIEQAPLQWHFIVTIGQPGDPTADATIAWPDNREHVDVGTLTVNHVESEAPGNSPQL